MGGYWQNPGAPNLGGYVGLAFGTWGDGGSPYWLPASIGFAWGQNPAYYLDNFLALYPKWFGPATAISGASTTANSNVVGVLSTTGIAVGQFVQVPNVPPGTIITAIGNSQITLSNQATANGSNVTFTVFESPAIPIAAIQLYINLASASLIQARFQEYWTVAMGLFIAHYCTLYAKSDAAEITQILQTAIHSETPAGAIPGTVYTLSSAPPSGVLQGLFMNGQFMTPGVDYVLSGQTITFMAGTPAGATITATWPVQSATQIVGVPSTAQMAAQGLMTGVEASKSVGDVSVSFSILEDQSGWGSLRMTLYGSQLIDIAKVIGSGPVLFT